MSLDGLSREFRKGLCLAIATVGLISCGGGSSGDPAAPAPSSVCTGAGAGEIYSTQVKTGVTLGQSAAATVAGCSGAIESPQWTQTGGPASVALLSDKTQTIAFDPPQTGTYTLRLTFSDGQGVARSEDLAIAVGAAAPASQMALRVSQSVRMGGNVSVRAWPVPQPGDSVRSITWTQLEGPAVTLDVRDPYVALFVAPEVAGDTLIRLRATLTTAAGQTVSDDALVLVERHVQAAASDGEAVWSGDHISRVYAYKPAGPYAAVLARCVYDSGLRYTGAAANLCPLSQLPFLAQQTGGGVPTVEQVMDRVIVSHDWVGRNFEAFLRQHDTRGDFRRMLNSVTAVVIGVQVRPSFYYALAGAIYLDADNFWLTPEERDTVNEAPDYRSGFGATLGYTTLWRYVNGSSSIFTFDDPRRRRGRSSASLLHEVGWLLLHELGHALDFLPPAAYGTLAAGQSAWANIAPRYQAGQLTSDFVNATYPLTSSVMAGLARVRFFGATATPAQNAYDAAQVAAFFSADLATDDYAYASQYEDAAMSLEEFLMSHRLGLRRDVAFVAPIGAGATGSTILVQWGQRGRIGEAALRPRLRAIVQRLAPWVDPAEVDRLPAPLPMRLGRSWTDTLVLPSGLPPPLRAENAEKAMNPVEEMWLIERAQRRQQKQQRQQAVAKPLPQRP